MLQGLFMTEESQSSCIVNLESWPKMVNLWSQIWCTGILFRKKLRWGRGRGRGRGKGRGGDKGSGGGKCTHISLPCMSSLNEHMDTKGRVGTLHLLYLQIFDSIYSCYIKFACTHFPDERQETYSQEGVFAGLFVRLVFGAFILCSLYMLCFRVK